MRAWGLRKPVGPLYVVGMSNLRTMPDRLRVLSPESEEVPLASFWSDAPVLLVFVRHFG